MVSTWGAGSLRWPLLFCGCLNFMRTTVYIDGFNLYYRALKGSKHKWLDLKKLAEGNSQFTIVKEFRTQSRQPAAGKRRGC